MISLLVSNFKIFHEQTSPGIQVSMDKLTKAESNHCWPYSTLVFPYSVCFLIRVWGHLKKMKQETSQIKRVRQAEQSHTFHFIYCVESKAWKKWTGLRSQRTEPAFRKQCIRKMDQFACIINWLLFTLGQNCEEQCQVDAKIWPSGKW